MAYTSVPNVEAALGRSLTGHASVRANQLLSVADAFVDERSGHPWNTTATVTDELHRPDDELLDLRRTPVTSITSVKVRPWGVNTTETTLTAGTDYELINATGGKLLVPGYAGSLVKVTYVPNVPNDTRIVEAATQLVAHWLRPTLDGVAGDVKSYSMGQELSVTFRDPGSGMVLGVPSEIVSLIDQAAGGPWLVAVA